ncbi:MAG: protein-export chaperone SecB [Tropicimonas sp.]|uniref:protein-export chaperone SecB n=1 Tax=Tropicimonas sp. TaxID=2067044 RepID=UPI003A851F71
MTDQPTENGTTPEGTDQQQAAQPKMQVLGQFIRDLSFENVVAQKGVNGEIAPDVQVQVNLDAKKRNLDNQYEVITKFKIESRNKGESKAPLFLLELEYGGIFLIENIPAEQLHPFLLIECPRMLFPFVRRIVSDVTRDGGFPPLNLDNVDFVALYRQEIIRRAQAEQAAKAKPDA